MVTLSEALELSLDAMSSAERHFGEFKYAFVKTFLVTDAMYIIEDKSDQVFQVSSNVYVLSKVDVLGNRIDHIGIKDGQFFYLVGLFEDRKEIRNLSWLSELVEGIVPIQFSKENMFNALKQYYADLVLWEYRSKKARVQSYFKDETLYKENMWERLTQDESFGLKPYLASFRLKMKPKKFSFTISAEGYVTADAQIFKELSVYMPQVLSRMNETEADFLNFVRVVRLERPYSSLPSIPIGASLGLIKQFDIKRFIESSRDDFQYSYVRIGKDIVDGTFLDKTSGEYVTLTAFPSVIYIFPRTSHSSKQKSLVAGITYLIDNLFGLSSGQEN